MWRIYRPDAILVWRDEEVKRRLRRYYGILNNKYIAKFLIAKKIPVKIDDNDSLEKLWREHDRASKVFRETMKKIDEGELKYGELETPEISYLDLKVEIAKRILQSCHFCERRCQVDRLNGKTGFCRLDKTSRVSSAFLHLGEEAPLVPSGTIFFTSCTFKCVFCQNYDISTDPYNGVEVDGKRLASIAAELFREGARNINYVGGEPTPNLHVILEAMKYLKVNVTQLWNSNMYCSEETMKLLLDVIDFWLPDFKYGNDECAERLSKVKNYFEVVSRNHKLAYEEGGGEMIIRHLVLPNHVECCTRPVLEWIAKHCPNALVNIMEQYRPMHLVPKDPAYKDINRRPTYQEMKEAYKIADDLGLLWRPVS
ncbi:MAG: radical SAM protein [Candidatus Baldrarchaeia archaeon]